MKILLISANLGSFDTTTINHKPQILDPAMQLAYVDFTNLNFPPRFNSLHPRLQAKIPKMLAWEYFPDYDYYVWIDGAVQIESSDFIKILISSIHDSDIVLLRHPEMRKSIREELDYMHALMKAGSEYLLKRYENELMQEQYNLYSKDINFKDENLFACTFFMYSNKMVENKSEFFREWYYHCARYSVQDQLSLPFLLYKHNIDVKILNAEDFDGKTAWLGHQRNRVA